MPTVGRRPIVYSDLDFNHHMNNTKYADMLCDFIPDMAGRYVSALSLSYLREATFGDEITVHRQSLSPDGSCFLFKTVSSTTGQICLEAQVELSSVVTPKS